MSYQYRITKRRPLLLQPNDPAGRHISAASGVAWLSSALLMIDDASTFAGIFTPDEPLGSGLRLFPSIEGHDQFSEATGTKGLKPDLEVVVPWRGSLLALGSGSRNRGVGDRSSRVRAVLISPEHKVEIFHLGALYDALAKIQESLNVEGAIPDGEGLRIFLRGNGRGGYPMEVKLASIEEALAGRPRIEGSQALTLPLLRGSQLGVTDACCLPDGSCLAALAAEDSADVYADGEVAGSCLYDLDQRSTIPLVEANGELFRGKLEGICPQQNRLHLFGVTDPDDPNQPGELLWLEREENI